MKILVVSLLRLGDVVATSPAVKAIRERHPGAEIHILVNSNFRETASRINGVQKVISFERDRLQSSCVESERPFFEAYDWMQLFIDDVNSENYGLLYNFTHNRLSGWLCGLIEAKEKIGLVLDGSGAVSYGSSWIRHLNQQVDFDEADSFNHTDVFLGAAGGLALAEQKGFFDNLINETDAGREEARKHLESFGAEKLVLFQISTSDEKKDWGDQRFQALARRTLTEMSDVSILVLGAPNERARIEKFCDGLSAFDGRIRPAIASLDGVVSLLEVADLLVTGDTSIKHFASASTTKIIEIVVGSADAHRTGSWKSGDIVVTSREPCAPCGHSEACHRTTHACAEAIDPSAVFELMVSSMDSKSRAAASSINVFEVDRSEGIVSLRPLDETSLTDREIARALERSARRIVLEMRDRRRDASGVGSEILKLRQFLSRRFKSVSSTEIKHILNEGERRLRHAEGILQSLQIQMNRLQESIQDAHRMREMTASITVMRSRLFLNPWTRFVAEPLVQIIEDDRSAPFAKFRKISDAVKDLEIRLKVGLKLTRGLELEFENLELSVDSFSTGDRT